MAYRNIISKIIWSFSSLHLYEQCPYAFYLNKIEKREGEPNFYAENGSAMHEVLAAILEDKITLEEAPEIYLEKYDNIYSHVADNIMENTFETCVKYLCNVEPLSKKRCEILGVEMKLEFMIGRYNCVGYADAVIRDKYTNEIYLIDHKSSPHFLKKNGEPFKAQEENFYAYRHQMYLYCYGLKEQYGIQVDNICWHHFRDGGALTIIPFREEDSKETLDWALNLIREIHKDPLFEPHAIGKDNYMMCHQLCDYRTDCEYLLMDEDEEEE